MVTAAMKLKDACSWKKSYDKPRQHIKKQRYHFAEKVCIVKAIVFPVVMYGCERWTIKKAEHWRIGCFWIVVLEKTLESPLDCKEVQPVNPKGNWSWIFIARTNAEIETPILWPPDEKNWLKDWRQEVKGMTEDEMVGWHHQLNGHELE